MLNQLSLRNAKRQFREYALFFVTLTCMVAAMYAFNALLFSDTVKSLPDMEILPYMIIAASVLIVLITGWLVGYMVSYMQKRRSREFSIYMISGIPNRRIGVLIFRETILIGILAFIPGILIGMLAAQLLEAVLLSLFGLPYLLHFGFSPPAAGLTCLYFLAMLLYSIRRNGRRICRMQLRDLLSYDRQNENPLVSGSFPAVIIFLLSVLACCGGFLLISFQPIGKGSDILFGTILSVLFLFGFFTSVPAFLVTCFGNRTGWKYRRHRLVAFRNFTAKIHSKSVLMGILSILFMLTIAFGGIGTAIGLMMRQNIKEGAFDIMILHRGELSGFREYETVIRQDFPVQGHAYGIYTDGQTEFRSVHDQAVADAGRSLRFTYAEFRYDTCMTQSDYLKLRSLLGYRSLPLDPSRCYMHCVPALESSYKTLILQQDSLACAGYPFAEGGVFSEPFAQVSGYGNGFGYIVIVPDDAVSRLETVYSVYAAVSEAPLTPGNLQHLIDSCDGLVPLDRASAKSSPDGYPTVFIRDDANDYLSGKWMDKAEFHYLYSVIICLFYLAFLLEITGAAILATQVLGDWQEKQRQDRILLQLGMSRRMLARQNNRQLLQLFLLPLFPALVLGSAFLSICTKQILVGFFLLPVIPDILWILQSLAVSLFLFSLLYSIYYAAARISYGRAAW